jgi:hypothetical protein
MEPVKGEQGPVWAVAPLIIIIFVVYLPALPVIETVFI